APLRVKYRRLFDLSTNKTSSVAAMFELGWEEGGRRGSGAITDCGDMTLLVGTP
ncbi:hypothetical protein A2U01_0054973, partial [Trifolium medium]|nr:hypothetical protein [Trifolium medium]